VRACEEFEDNAGVVYLINVAESSAAGSTGSSWIKGQLNG